MLRIIERVLMIVMILIPPLWFAFWLTCRLGAKQCPKCGSKWRTELVGEWDGEMWDCHACGHHWETKYKPKWLWIKVRCAHCDKVFNEQVSAPEDQQTVFYRCVCCPTCEKYTSVELSREAIYSTGRLT